MKYRGLTIAATIIPMVNGVLGSVDDAPAVHKPRRQWSMIAPAAVLVCLFLIQAARQNTIDLDLFHQMALIRAALELGYFPKQDVFAYTSGGPSIHYEWGNGAIAYPIVRYFGYGGLLLLKYVLSAAAVTFAVLVAKRRGSHASTFFVLAPMAIGLLTLGFTTLRAGFFTLLFVSMLLWFIEMDRSGRRWWIAPWLVIYVVWLNIHPGFIVGGALLALYWFERVIRTRMPQWHLIATGIAMILLVLVNPYTIHYPPALWHALTMQLPPIPEWLPMWKFPAAWLVGAYGLTLIVALYAIGRVGWRRTEGALILLVCAMAACQHVRHVYLYAIVWLAYVPAWFSGTPLGEKIAQIWRRREWVVLFCCVALIVACVPRIILAETWRVRFPVRPADVAYEDNPILFPVGAVEYLQHLDHANVMTHYNDGSYVMWRLWPRVKVGMDSRNDVGYPYELVNEIVAFYKARPGWRATLNRFPTDLVLINRADPLATMMAAQSDWKRVYRDEAFELWARPGMELPVRN